MQRPIGLVRSQRWPDQYSLPCSAGSSEGHGQVLCHIPSFSASIEALLPSLFFSKLDCFPLLHVAYMLPSLNHGTSNAALQCPMLSHTHRT